MASEIAEGGTISSSRETKGTNASHSLTKDINRIEITQHTPHHTPIVVFLATMSSHITFLSDKIHLE